MDIDQDIDVLDEALSIPVACTDQVVNTQASAQAPQQSVFPSLPFQGQRTPVRPPSIASEGSTPVGGGARRVPSDGRVRSLNRLSTGLSPFNSGMPPGKRLSYESISPRFSVDTSGPLFQSPSTYETSSEEPLQPLPKELVKAHQKVNGVVQKNPNAHGIVLLVHNERTPATVGLEQLTGIDNGARELEATFTKLGLAVVWLKNPSKDHLLAVIKVISSPCEPQLKSQPPIVYPTSYQHFIFYTTGHGAQYVFFTKDGAISYNDVVDAFSPRPSKFQTWHFFFDNCRSSRIDDQSLYPNGETEIPRVPNTDVLPENCIVYATAHGTQAWGPGGGVSYMTKAMTRLLLQCHTMDELVSKLQEDPEIPEIQFPTAHNATSKKVNFVKKRNEAMKPKVESCRVATDGAVVNVSLSLPEPLINIDFFNLHSLRFQLKRTKDAKWENLNEIHNQTNGPIPMSNPSTDRLPSRNGRASAVPFSMPLHDAASFQKQYGTFSQSLHLREDVSEPSGTKSPQPEHVSRVVSVPVDVKVRTAAELRAVAYYDGRQLKVESDPVKCLLRPVARPDVNVCIRKTLCSNHIALVTGNTGQNPSIPVSRFHVSVYEGESQQVLHLATVPVTDRTRQSYDCAIPLKYYQEGVEYSVVVSAERTNGEHVPSERTSVSCRKGCCGYTICVCKWICAGLFCKAAILLAILLIINSINPHSYHYTVPAALRNLPFDIQTSPGPYDSISNFLQGPDFSKQSVSWNGSVNTDEINSIYCAEISDDMLASSQKNRFIRPTNSINQVNTSLTNSTQYLPLGSAGQPFERYLLSNSVFSLYMCIYEPAVGIAPPLEFQLYRYDAYLDISTAQPLQQVSVTFNSSWCANVSIVVENSDVLIGALSTNGDLAFQLIQGFVKQFYYDETILQVKKDANKVPQDGSKRIPTQKLSRLVCYIASYYNYPAVLNLLEVHIPTRWNVGFKLAVAGTVLLAIGTLFVVTVGCCCICYKRKKKLGYICCKSENYKVLNNQS